jgi:hypothetical protein
MTAERLFCCFKFLSENPAEAAPTPVLSVAEGPPNCRAWEPGQLVSKKVKPLVFEST